MPPFTFRMRAYAAAHFEAEEKLEVTWPDAVAFVQSEFVTGEDGAAYPVTLHAEIRSDGPSIEEAEPRLANTIGNVLPALALASNAAIATPLPITTHGLDLTTPQPVIWYHTPDPGEWFPPGARRFDCDATRALLAAVGGHPETDFLMRAVEAYRQALGHWTPEEVLLAGEFLYIAAETLSRFLVDSRATEKGITTKNLVKLVGAESAKALRWSYLAEEVFAGDDEALEAMDQASNGFEHGFLSGDDVRTLFGPVLARSMGHVRRALIEATGLDPENRARLLNSGYDEPRGLVPVIRMLHGELSRSDPDAPPPAMDGAAVELEWKVEQVTTTGPDGKVAISYPNKVSARRMPENAKLDCHRISMRAAYVHLLEEDDGQVDNDAPST